MTLLCNIPLRSLWMVEHLIHTYEFNLEHIKKIVADVSDEQMTLQPNGLVNHPAWTLGHLASTSDMLAKTLSLESTFPEEWKEACKTGGTPSGDAAVFASKEQLLAELSNQHARVAEAVKQAGSESFTAESEENFRKMFPTVGDIIMYLMSAHEGTHIGQLQTWKRAAGLTDSKS